MMGEGGALVTNDKYIFEFARRFRQHGADSEKPYVYHHLGYNYRSTDILASIGLAQIDYLKKWTAKRIKNAKKMILKLQNIPGIILPELPVEGKHVFHQFTIRVTDDFPMKRDELYKYLLRNGVRTAIYYPSVLPSQPHIQEIIPFKKNMYPVAQKLSEQVLSLPIHPNLKDSEIETVAGLIKNI